MIFDNTYIDYSSKTKTELYQTLILFLILSNKNIVRFGKILLTLSLKLNLPILGLIKNTVFTHFCGGENIEDCQEKIQNLRINNIKTILDYSIEGKNDEVSFQRTYTEIQKVLIECEKNPLIPFCVFKVTGLASFHVLKKINQKEYLSDIEKTDFLKFKQRINKICKKAEDIGIPILIDAEESWIQNTIDELAEEMMSRYNTKKVIVYHTIQLYRKDKLQYIKDIHAKSKSKKYKLGLKLVRGAYMEKERLRAKKKQYKCPIHVDKNKCDHDYNAASKYCLNHIGDISICFGTHNEKSTQIVLNMMKEKNIKNNDPRIYFAQLLGMSDNISYYLGYHKYNTAKYVPYGPVKEVLPYLIRRAEENSSISGQTNREIQRIKTAIKNIKNNLGNDK
tara:strand:- start:617 stop:1795 length:1179 start_codon:yes stop_codon:yes gene_type:complete